MKNVLIPTDFSHHSRHSIECVLDLLQNTSKPCRILLVNSFMILQTDAKLVIAQNDEAKQISLDGLLRDKNFANKNLPNPLITIETVSHMGSLRNVISHLLLKERFDLIAMGKDGGKNIETISKLLKVENKCSLLVTYDSK